jgi:hypothetical protein
MAGIWYNGYEKHREEVDILKREYNARCEQLAVEPGTIKEELWREVIARIVHESNWQEDLYLDPARTRELAEVAFDDPIHIAGPHLDMNGVTDAHRLRVLSLKRERRTTEEIAAYNLSRAHVAIDWIANEMAARQAACLMATLERFRDEVKRHEADNPGRKLADSIRKGFETIDKLRNSTAPVYGPMCDSTSTEGELTRGLLNVEFHQLLNPMRVEYIHFLHRLTTMGLIERGKCGIFRKSAVHISGNPDLFFPLPSLIGKMMEEFCRDFPTVLPSTVNYDPIRKAAEASYAFVRIHPYADGNGRVSRLLMNLVLWKHYPPVWLKADKKGRHRYIQALKRADRGNITPLACLIAISLKGMYQGLLASVGGRAMPAMPSGKLEDQNAQDGQDDEPGTAQ